MSEVNYWSNFYAQNRTSVPEEASSFAHFTLDWLRLHNISISKEKKLVDIGCGTARDTRFFASSQLTVVGIDQAPSTIDKNNAHKGHRENYVVGDFTRIENPDCQAADILYSRFSIHSVSKQNASNLYQWAIRQGLKQGGLFFIEARSINDPLFKQGTPDPAGDPDASICGHYRRFIRLEDLNDELSRLGFSILYQGESNGWSVCGNDDPTLIRVVARKNQ